jgi:uncharacterized membrane protein
MRNGLIAATLLLTACGTREDASDAPPAATTEPPSLTSQATSSSTPRTDNGAGEGWALQSSGETLVLSEEGSVVIRLFCPSRENRLLVNVPRFRPVGSEERLSFGSGDEAVALVADTRGDAQLGGVSATGEVPSNLAALIRGPLSASYGAQRSGPHPAPPQNLSRTFVAACSAGSAATPTDKSSPESTSACLMQGSERLRVTPLRAVGTEPFWAGRIEGRCVNYSHPENQDGTRVWTRYTKRADGDTWSGALDGRPFELRTRAQPGCSDGMSDKRYPLAVELIVHGELRRGCAEPI